MGRPGRILCRYRTGAGAPFRRVASPPADPQYWPHSGEAAEKARIRYPVHRNEEHILHILFVCTGNICRSPTAERLTVAYASTTQIPDLTATSAGTRAVIGHPIHPDAAEILQALGGDSAGFAARQLTPKIATAADLVLTMTRAHRDTVLERAPQQLRRTFSIPEASQLVTNFGAQSVSDLANLRPHLRADAVPDILDPIGQSPEVFAAVGAQIADLLPPILDLCRHR